MIKHPKNFRRIYMVSSAVFSATSCVFGWATPLGAALGLAVNLTEDYEEIGEQLEEAVNCALQRTYESVTSDTKKKILDDLFEMEVMPDNLSELIKKTETYQTRYCTETDVKEILNIFELFFRDEIAKRHHLSNLYVLSTGSVTIEKLKQINDIIVNDEKKLDDIVKEVSGFSKVIKNAEKICINCLNSIAFIMISMAIFLGIAIFSKHHYDRMVVLIAFICYTISDFLIFFLRKRQDILIPIYEKLKKIDKVCYKITGEVIIPAILTVSCFWIIIFATDIIDNNFGLTTCALIIGKIISLLLENIMFRNQ